MHWSSTTLTVLGLFLIASPAQANKNRTDLCGMSMHASDMPNIGSFAAVQGTWVIPEGLQRYEDSERDAPGVSQSVALCCGDDCSLRLAAGTLSYPREDHEKLGYYTAEPWFQLSPAFPAIQWPADMDLTFNTSAVIRSNVQILGPSKAKIIFSHYLGEGSGLQIRADIEISMNSINIPEMHVNYTGSHGQGTFKRVGKMKDIPQPELCGDSAWWFVSDRYDVGPETDPTMERKQRPDALGRFTPVLISNPRLWSTGNGQSDPHEGLLEENPGLGRMFPAYLPFSGLARFWDMVRHPGVDEDGNKDDTVTEVMCRTRAFLDDDMIMMHAPYAWGAGV
ncbi:uncharacterized protein C8A04DRAFT_14651 [Dichotomopilus funicola]|uniref:Uncharacterized protein n=1 Tax=Dichotomopilus funicola TaxID=1934379 RepID=A0AAN6UZG1_9PEZI|nr:hypothetical protein C8A04DRAFT_14651 [Dichotomopilus funicola]